MWRLHRHEHGRKSQPSWLRSQELAMLSLIGNVLPTTSLAKGGSVSYQGCQSLHIRRWAVHHVDKNVDKVLIHCCLGPIIVLLVLLVTRVIQRPRTTKNPKSETGLEYADTQCICFLCTTRAECVVYACHHSLIKMLRESQIELPCAQNAPSPFDSVQCRR